MFDGKKTAHDILEENDFAGVILITIGKDNMVRTDIQLPYKLVSHVPFRVVQAIQQALMIEGQPVGNKLPI